MKKKLLYLMALFFITLGSVAQPLPGGPLTTVGNVAVCPGATTVDIPVTVSQFQAVGSLSLRFAYTASEISSPALISLNPGIAAWGTFEVNTSVSGIIIMAAYDPDVEAPIEGLTLGDGSTLFILRFTIGTISDKTSVTFYDNTQGTACEYSGVGPDFTPYGDTPANEFYFNGDVEVVDFTSGTIAGDQFICENSDVAGFTSAGAEGEGSFTYQWQLSTTSGTENFIDIVGANAETYDPGAIAADTWYRREVTSTLLGTECVKISNAVKVTVINFVPGSIAGDQTLCSGYDAAELTSETEASGDGTLTYQWQSSTTGAGAGFSDIDGATSATFDPDVILADTWFQRGTISSLGGAQCTEYSNVVKVTANQRKTISGLFNYYNIGGNFLLDDANITVKLYNSTDVLHENLLGTVVTDGSGYYEFTNLCPDCSYDIVATSTGTTDGAVNATDAGQVNYWGAHNSLIEKVRFYAGDVGTSGIDQDLSVTSIDAARIKQHFVYGNDFDRPWTFWVANDAIAGNPATESYPSVDLPVGSDKTANMYGLCTGDFNRSFNPNLLKSASSTLELVYNGNRQIGREQEFDLPVRLVNTSTVGAVSLILEFPSDLVEIKDVIMNGSNDEADWNVRDGELRIGWNSASPVSLADAAEMLTLRLKTTSAFTTGNTIRFTLATDPLNELADESYNVIGNVVLSVETVDATAVGINEQPLSDGMLLASYPNPCSNFTMLTYSIPADGLVTLEIRGIMGSEGRKLVKEMQVAGNHAYRLNTEELPAGIYLATLRLQSSGDEFVRTIKVLKNN